MMYCYSHRCLCWRPLVSLIGLLLIVLGSCVHSQEYDGLSRDTLICGCVSADSAAMAEGNNRVVLPVDLVAHTEYETVTLALFINGNRFAYLDCKIREASDFQTKSQVIDMVDGVQMLMLAFSRIQPAEIQGIPTPLNLDIELLLKPKDSTSFDDNLLPVVARKVSCSFAYLLSNWKVRQPIIINCDQEHQELKADSTRSKF